VAAAALRPLLSVPTGAGTAPRANIGRPQGGKTGTHQAFRDAWYVGFTPEYSAAVWVGYEAKQIPLTNVVINGELYARVFGGSVPAPIWAEFMRIVTEGLPIAEFPPEPPGMEPYLLPPRVPVPSVVGLHVEEARQRLKEANLNARVEVQPSVEPKDVVFEQNPTAGATIEEGFPVTIYVSSGEPPVGELPRLVGLTFDEALEVLRAFEEESGVLVNLTRKDRPVDDPDQIGRILATDPPPGTEVTYGVTVTATIGVAKTGDDP
jgi:hypothetical protein